MVNKYDNYELKRVTSLENVPGVIKDGDGYIWDPSGLPDKDFDVSKVPLEYRRLAVWMRSKLFGKEVRETIARFIELSGVIDDRQKSVESLLLDLIRSVTESELNSGPEIIQARGGRATLGRRLDETEAQLALKASKQEVEVERLRINALSQLEEGSTTGDAELMDIRIGIDGTVYESAGEAVRNILTPFMANEGDDFNVV